MIIFLTKTGLIRVAEEACLSLTWLQIPKTGLLMTWLNYKFNTSCYFVAQQMAMSADTKLKEVRHDLNQEKMRYLTLEKGYTSKVEEQVVFSSVLGTC